MRGSRNFRQGGGGSRSVCQKKALTTFFFFFFILSLFYRSQMVNFKEIYHFSRFQRGSNIFYGGPTFSGGRGGVGGGSNCLFPIETHITCYFPGGVWTPCPPSGSALANKCLILCSQIYNFTTHDACANHNYTCNYIESNAYFAIKYFMIE